MQPRAPPISYSSTVPFVAPPGLSATAITRSCGAAQRSGGGGGALLLLLLAPPAISGRFPTPRTPTRENQEKLLPFPPPKSAFPLVSRRVASGRHCHFHFSPLVRTRARLSFIWWWWWCLGCHRGIFFFVCRVGWWSERGREGTRRGGGGGGGYCSRDEQLRWHQLRRLRWYVSFH